MNFGTCYAQVTTRTNDASANAVNVAKANVNFAYQDICTRNPFSWLISTGTITTTAAQAWSVISTAGITDFWKTLSIRQEDGKNLITAISRKEYERYVSDDSTSTDEPECYCDEYNDRIYWYHTPDDAYVLPATYWKAVTDITADGDGFSIPAKYQEAITLGAWSRQLQYFNRYAEANAIKVEYEAFLQKMIDEDNDRPDLIELQQKHIIGGQDFGPKLPSQYRRF